MKYENVYKEKNFNRIKNKIERNIDIIYNHQNTLAELEKFNAKYQNFNFVISEAKKCGIFNKASITFFDDEIERDYIKDIHSFVVLLVTQIIEINKNNLKAYDKEFSLLKSILDNKHQKDIFYKTCININKNPLLWKDVVTAKFLGVPQKIAMLFIKDLMYNNYLPKINYKKNKILIEINEMTTPEDIDYIWKYEVKPLQQAIIKDGQFVYSGKKYPNSERDKRYKELRDRGKTNNEARKILTDEGYLVYDYPNMSKMKKAYKKKYVE